MTYGRYGTEDNALGMQQCSPGVMGQAHLCSARHGLGRPGCQGAQEGHAGDRERVHLWLARWIAVCVCGADDAQARPRSSL